MSFTKEPALFLIQIWSSSLRLRNQISIRRIGRTCLLPQPVFPGKFGSGHSNKGMLYVAIAMALTMLDMYQKPELLAVVRKEFTEKKGDRVFKAMLPDGPPPVPQK